jgi:hypothetical protein
LANGIGQQVACPYAAHHYYGTSFSDATLSAYLIGSASLANSTGLYCVGNGGAVFNAPLGNAGWSVALTVGVQTVSNNQTLLVMNGLKLSVVSGIFYLN